MTEEIKEVDYERKEKMTSYIILLLVVIILALSYIIVVMPTRVCHEVKTTNTFKCEELASESFPLSTKIVCEEGCEVYSYYFLNEKIVYFCLHLNENKICEGWGKMCIVEKTEQICEIK